MSHYTGMREGEVFIGNADDGIPDYIKHLPSVRLGDVALDIEGRKLSPEFRPIFMSKSDSMAYDRIMVARYEAVNRGERREPIRPSIYAALSPPAPPEVLQQIEQLGLSLSGAAK